MRYTVYAHHNGHTHRMRQENDYTQAMVWASEYVWEGYETAWVETPNGIIVHQRNKSL